MREKALRQFGCDWMALRTAMLRSWCARASSRLPACSQAHPRERYAARSSRVVCAPCANARACRAVSAAA
jgi:hypothetical protein